MIQIGPITISYMDWGKYIRIYDELPEGRKTPIYYLYNQQDERIKLGCIKWHGAWRKFCFFPEDETLYDSKCLIDISRFIDRIMEERKTK